MVLIDLSDPNLSLSNKHKYEIKYINILIKLNNCLNANKKIRKI